MIVDVEKWMDTLSPTMRLMVEAVKDEYFKRGYIVAGVECISKAYRRGYEDAKREFCDYKIYHDEINRLRDQVQELENALTPRGVQ